MAQIIRNVKQLTLPNSSINLETLGQLNKRIEPIHKSNVDKSLVINKIPITSNKSELIN